MRAPTRTMVFTEDNSPRSEPTRPSAGQRRHRRHMPRQGSNILRPRSQHCLPHHYSNFIQPRGPAADPAQWNKSGQIPVSRRLSAKAPRCPLRSRLPEIRLELSRLVLEQWADDFGHPLAGREDDVGGKVEGRLCRKSEGFKRGLSGFRRSPDLSAAAAVLRVLGGPRFKGAQIRCRVYFAARVAHRTMIRNEYKTKQDVISLPGIYNGLNRVEGPRV